MEENFEFTKLSNEDLLELYKQVNDYIAFLEKEIKEKGTEEKWVIFWKNLIAIFQPIKLF